ncbi:MAG: PKD domain-containing protein, partial [Flavobacteriales bacterium]|nr:PKD domain-containing protein [Flavobacteriales bacterium]
GASSGLAGTKTNPANLTYGLTLTNTTDNIVRLSAGTYPLSSEFVMIGGITLEGGFNASTWVKSNVTPTIFQRDTANTQSNPSRLVAFSCVGISNFRILDITITMDDAVGNGVSTYGIYLDGCSNFTLSRCIINLGNASDGFLGATGNPGMGGAQGTDGESGSEQGDCCKLPGIGGSGSFGGSNPGGNGGAGANRPTFDVDTILGLCYSDDFRTEDGFSGYAGLGMGGAQGGIGGDGVCELVEYVSTSCAATATNHGGTGAVGTVGYNGQNGLQAYASYTGGFYVPATGTIGTQAVHGGGGGGAGGGGAKGCEPVVINPSSCDTVFWSWGSGGGGGGGGEGGQGGFSGLGGEGGGGSFCIFTWNSGVNGQVRDCYLNPGTSGIGGLGGPGGAGGPGGQGGQGGTTGQNLLDTTKSCNTGEGGDGGLGAAGGIGGTGGLGSDGLSMQIYEDTAGNPMLVSNAYNPFEPVVTVDFSGCSNSDIIFGTTATGNIDWIFGFGANPAGSASAMDTVQYASGALGSRTITLIVDGVPYTLANFITLNVGYQPPEIEASSLVICAGDNMTLTSSGNADTYNWSITGGTPSSSTLQNPGAIPFNTPGTYLITLTTNSCCGVAYTEQEVEVIGSVTVDLGADTSVCFTDVLPTFDASNPGAVYSWMLNGAPIGAGTQTLQASSPGTYAVTVTYGSCSTTSSVEFSIFTSLPVNMGGDTSICINDAFPILDAGLPNMSYSWSLDGNPVGTNDQTLATTIPGTYSVIVTSATGCQGADSLTLSLSLPEVELGSNKSVCDNEPFPILYAGNPGSSYSWFLNGLPIGIDSIEIQTFAGGTYSVLIVNQFGCTAGDSILLTVLTTLTGNFTSPATANVGALVSFIDNSSPGPVSWNWNFGDSSPNDTTQNPTHTYNTAGIYPVFVIVGNGVCYDTVTTTIEILNDCGSFGLTSAFSPLIDTIDLAGLGIASFTSLSTNALSWLWDFGDGTAPSTVLNPNHTFTNTGVYTVTLYAYNYNCTDISTGTIVVINSTTLPPVDTTDTTTGIGLNISGIEVWTVSPNPNNGIFYIEANLMNRETYYLELYNIVGELILREEIKTPTKYRGIFDLSQEAKGIYLVKLRSSEASMSKKIIIH